MFIFQPEEIPNKAPEYFQQTKNCCEYSMSQVRLPNTRFQKIMSNPSKSQNGIFNHSQIINPITATVSINKLISQQIILRIGFQQTPVVNEIPIKGINSRYSMRYEPECQRNCVFVFGIHCRA